MLTPITQAEMVRITAKKKEAEERKAKAIAAAAEAKRLKEAAAEAAKAAAIAAAVAAGKERPASPPGMKFACFTCTRVQVLTLARLPGEPDADAEEEIKLEDDGKVEPDPEKPGPVVIEGLPEVLMLY
jgi:hypothetical protein